MSKFLNDMGVSKLWQKTKEKINPVMLISMYNEIDVIPMDENCFIFDEINGAITGLVHPTNEELWNKLNASEYIIPYSINGILVKSITNLKGYHPSKIRFPNSLRRIEDNACEGISGLQSINIPTSCEYIGKNAFASCYDMKEVITPIKPNWELIIGESAFSYIDGFNNIDTIIDGIKQIPYRAFYGCERLYTVTIPESVDYISSEAFTNCEILNTITILNSGITLEEGFCDNSVILRGYSGSLVESYAETHGNPFVPINAVYIDVSKVGM